MKLADLDKLRIIYYPDPTLKQVCQKVENFGADPQRLGERMLALMKKAEGVGLAAPQVGIPIRLFVYNLTGEPEDDLICVNPRLIELTGVAEHEEGCLSIPGVSVTMRRSAHAKVEAFDTNGQPFHKTGEVQAARVWQHEMDHLNGRLITDNMSQTDEIANRRAIKLLESEYAALHSRKKKRRCASSS